MDVAAQSAAFRTQHEQRRQELQAQLSSVSQQVNLATHEKVQSHPTGRKLLDKKNQLRTDLETRKKQLYNEFVSNQQRLNDQYGAECTAIDHELCQIGGNIANTHQDINPMMAEYVRTEQELSNHDKKGMDDFFNMLSPANEEATGEPVVPVATFNGDEVQQQVAVHSGNPPVTESAGGSTEMDHDLSGETDKDVPTIAPGSQGHYIPPHSKFSTPVPTGQVAETGDKAAFKHQDPPVTKASSDPDPITVDQRQVSASSIDSEKAAITIDDSSDDDGPIVKRRRFTGGGRRS